MQTKFMKSANFLNSFKWYSVFPFYVARASLESKL
jgi:hypothetical protein